ncbi:MAG: CoB--CoM heterodisulfide reductase iron-sulfur subunit B family protein [Syntrophomonadaceae bacterium]|jgi:heterodisulfide reductase subunit B|nr:CoB--CoM heterodisulfide reductase iron-sulfur subunit B family protein [Syntrophomonadaceae bacterium]
MKYAYYPGCSLDATGVEFNMSGKAVAKHLGVELWEIPDWSCCGASAAHNTNHLLALALPARNLAMAEKEGLDVAVPCAACFNRMKHTEHAVRESVNTKKTVQEIIEMDYQGTSRAFNLLDILVNQVGIETIKEKVVKPLTGLKVACYYGCLLVRPPKIAQFDDPEDPQTMDRLVQALGGTPVSWSYKTECCGVGHATVKPPAALPLLHRIYQNARDTGADCLAVACPLCFLNLDMRQADVKKRRQAEYNLPVFYFTQLMGMAMGYSPKEMGISKHFVDPMPLLQSKDILRHPTTRREKA